jgi:hypothetical protein
MPSQYEGLLVRDNFQDVGEVPTTGNPYLSPDIIPVQSQSLTWAVASQKYGEDIGRQIVNGGVNNIYVRAKNLAPGNVTGTVALYYSNASLFLITTQWIQLTDPAGNQNLNFLDGSSNTSIAAGSVALVNPAFLLTGLPDGQHYCMITVIQTSGLPPVVIPGSFPSNADFAAWVQNNPAVAWRNLDVIANPVSSLIRTATFGNEDEASDNFVFQAVCTGFAEGSQLRSQCTDARLPIDQTDPIPLPDVNGHQIVTFNVVVPGGQFMSSMTFTATAPAGATIPAGASITFDYYQVPDQSIPLHRQVARMVTTARTLPGGRWMPKTSFLIWLGSYRVSIAAAARRQRRVTPPQTPASRPRPS